MQPPKRYAQRFLSNITALFDSKMPSDNTDVAIDLEDSEVAINSSKPKSGSASVARKERKQGTNKNNSNVIIEEHIDDVV